jgi:hypothetical protein
VEVHARPIITKAGGLSLAQFAMERILNEHLHTNPRVGQEWVDIVSGMDGANKELKMSGDSKFREPLTGVAPLKHGEKPLGFEPRQGPLRRKADTWT